MQPPTRVRAAAAAADYFCTKSHPTLYSCDTILAAFFQSNLFSMSLNIQMCILWYIHSFAPLSQSSQLPWIYFKVVWLWKVWVRLFFFLKMIERENSNARCEYNPSRRFEPCPPGHVKWLCDSLKHERKWSHHSSVCWSQNVSFKEEHKSNFCFTDDSVPVIMLTKQKKHTDR